MAPADRPPALTLIHLCFDAMVGLAFLLLLAGLWALWMRRRRTPCPAAVMVLVARGALRPGRAGGDGVRLGRDRGRAPAVGRVSAHDHRQAATTNGGVIDTLTAVIVVYAVLGAATVIILRMLARRWRQRFANRTGSGCPLRAAAEDREPTSREPT